MMDVQTRRQNSWFLIFLFAIVFQGFFVLMCTVYHDLILLSDPLFRAPSPDQTERFWALYETTQLPHSFLVGAVGVLLCIFGVLLFLSGGVSLIRHRSQAIGRGLCLSVAGLTLLACLAVFLYFRASADPYRFYMSCALPETLSVGYLILYLRMIRPRVS